MLNSNEVLNGTFPSKRRYSTAHNGIDISSPNGTQVKSRYAGIVRVTGINPVGKDFGNYIRVFHPHLNQSTWYAHLQSFQCSVNQQVQAGQVIGLSNNTGLSTGPHLHFSQSLGETTKWVDPDTQQEGGNEMNIFDVINTVFVQDIGRPATAAEAKSIIDRSGGNLGKIADLCREEVLKTEWVRKSEVTTGKEIEVKDIKSIILK